MYIAIQRNISSSSSSSSSSSKSGEEWNNGTSLVTIHLSFSYATPPLTAVPSVHRSNSSNMQLVPKESTRTKERGALVKKRSHAVICNWIFLLCKLKYVLDHG
jgi:hypothetical protein